MSIRVVTFRLRGGQLQPRVDCSNGQQSSNPPTFYTQTFGADRVTSVSDDAKTELLASADFQGQKPTDGPDVPGDTSLGIQNPGYIFSTYAKASYRGTGLRNTDGTLVYAADEEFVAEFVNEEDIGVLP